VLWHWQKTGEWQTGPFVREGAPQRQNSNVGEKNRKNKSAHKSQSGFDTKTYWLTDRPSVVMWLVTRDTCCIGCCTMMWTHGRDAAAARTRLSLNLDLLMVGEEFHGDYCALMRLTMHVRLLPMFRNPVLSPASGNKGQDMWPFYPESWDKRFFRIVGNHAVEKRWGSKLLLCRSTEWRFGSVIVQRWRVLSVWFHVRW
jgi:hypothetical protein